MSKRYSKPYDSKLSCPSKKAKLEITITSSQQAPRQDRHPSTSKNDADYDPWGADFNDKDIEEMDFAASQSLSIAEDSKISKIHGEYPKSSAYPSYFNSKPSTSYNITTNNSAVKKFEPKMPSKVTQHRQETSQMNNARNSLAQRNTATVGNHRQPQSSQQISSSKNQRDLFKHEQSILFDDFKDNLLKVNNHNSTFQSQILNKGTSANCSSRTTNISGPADSINISDDSILRQLEKLKLENKKLLDNFITKEGETAFLRNQLQQTLSRAEHDKIDKSRQIEEQANQYRSEINQAIKKEETLRTQLEFQSLQLNNLKERCKLLESGAIKLTQPHAAQLDSPSRNRLNTTLNRSSSAVKTVHMTESGVQTASCDLRNSYRLKRTLETYPLSRIPQSIFEPSRSEPSVVEIQIIEKVGTKNLPILQDEENVRIFENPDLVKPIVTMVNGQNLNVEFCSPDVAALMKKTGTEINGRNIFPTINKLVAVARELLLNTTFVLQRISAVIKNDDIRDMNDVYFSDLYKIHVDSTKSICDSNAWHDRERGIEAMRSLAILSYTAPASNYLSEYIAGEISLNLYNDSNYENYIQQMNSYNKWSKKGCEFEMLELLLEFVSTVGYVRRSHQFSGLIIAITKLLVNVKDRIVLSEKGFEYIFKILKEIIFARPLLVCYRYITEVLMTYSECIQFCKKLCQGTNKAAMFVWKDGLHFTPDACVMQIYIAQLEFFQPDSVAIVNITYSLVCFVSNILSLNGITWINQPGYACKCSMKLFVLMLNFLYKCSKVNFDAPVEQSQSYSHVAITKESSTGFHLSNESSEATVQNLKPSTRAICSNVEKLDKGIKIESKRKQLLTIRKGIMFLCYLSTRDPDFIIRFSDIEDSFNLFMHQIEAFDDIKLNETEQAALSSVKSTFVFDKTASSEGGSDQSRRGPALKSHFELKQRLPGLNGQQIVKSYDDKVTGHRQNHGHPSLLTELISKRRITERSVSEGRRRAQ